MAPRMSQKLRIIRYELDIVRSVCASAIAWAVVMAEIWFVLLGYELSRRRVMDTALVTTLVTKITLSRDRHLRTDLTLNLYFGSEEVNIIDITASKYLYIKS